MGGHWASMPSEMLQEVVSSLLRSREEFQDRERVKDEDYDAAAH